MSTPTITEIEAAIERDDWDKARRLLEEELRKTPEDHWLLTRLATTYYEQRNYEKALESSERAIHLAAGCPLVRWDYACALDMLDRTSEAIEQWKYLLKAGPKSIANDPCGEGREWATSLVNDCRYRLALAHADKGEFAKAIHYIRNYLKNRKTGVSSIYEDDEAEGRLGEWLRIREASLSRA